MVQFRALTAATLTGTAVVVAQVWLSWAVSILDSGGWAFEQVLFWGGFFALIACMLAFANALRRPASRFDVISSTVGALFALAWTIVGMATGFFLFGGSGEFEKMGPAGLALTAVVHAFYLFLLVRAVTGVARGPAVSMYWPLGLAVLPLVSHLLQPDQGDPGLVGYLEFGIPLWAGMVLGFWASQLRGGRNLVAWLGLSVSLVVTTLSWGLVEPNPASSYFLLVALLPLSLLGTKRGASGSDSEVVAEEAQRA